MRKTDVHLDVDALTVAMALVPALYSRNKMFKLFDDPVVKKARARGRLLRSIFRHLCGQSGRVADFRRDRGEVFTLHYRIPAVSLKRDVELSRVELACLVHLCDRAGVGFLPHSSDDRAILDAVLARLPADVHARRSPEERP